MYVLDLGVGQLPCLKENKNVFPCCFFFYFFLMAAEREFII